MTDFIVIYIIPIFINLTEVTLIYNINIVVSELIRMKFSTINPATEEKIKKYETYSLSKVNSILKKSKNSFNKWKKLSTQERANHFKTLSKKLIKEKNHLAKTITIEMGKPITESITEIEKCSFTCDYYAKNALNFLKNEIVQTENKKSYIRFEPLGIILSIMPWNFPFWQVFRFSVPSLCAGNVTLLKHSNQVPQCSLEIERIFLESGFPKGVFNSLIITSDSTSNLIHKVNAVSLTGSIETGKKIAEQAGKNLKKFVLELGGSDPFIVLNNANITFTCQNGIKSRFINAGQSCIAAKRFIITKSKEKEFIEKITNLTQNLVIGNPLDKKTNIGPLVNKKQLDTLIKQVNLSLKQGAKLHTGGKRKFSKGYFYEPTVLSKVKKSMAVIKEEVFGPVLPILTVNNNKEAIKEANSTSFGLGASIWTKDINKAEELAKDIEAGFVAINSIVKSDPRLPFGGIKDSGIGRELSRYGMLEFTNIKAVVVN